MPIILRPARPGPASSRLYRLGAARPVVASLLALGLAAGAVGCGGGQVQTLNPYTPTEGVNADIGSVNIRNLSVLSKAKGSGYLSASLISSSNDTLTAVKGNPIKADGSEGPAFTAKLTPISVGPALVVLTDRAPITLSSPELQLGLTAKLVLTFSKSGEVTTTAPVLDATQSGYVTATPNASPGASITPSN